MNLWSTIEFILMVNFKFKDVDIAILYDFLEPISDGSDIIQERDNS